MALLLTNAIFYHVPKTGGTWVRRVLAAAGIPHRELFCDLSENIADPLYCFHASYHHTILPQDGRKRFAFLFVRHPLTYYQSYWTFKMRMGWDMNNVFDRKFAWEDFQVFVHAVLSGCPGWVTKVFKEYAGPQDSPVADFIGKQETLRLDLLRVLKYAGEDIDKNFLMHAPSENESSAISQWQERCQYTPALREAVCEAECGAMSRFGYW
ncbi:MAG: hypothetical protein PHH13_03035 [Candidatus Peribacteraceae bacterium]|nr:hypothetical protein [Candidatus Peribacteraceae bacterium]